eukprot:3573537-Amphidinium_carterae.2
MKGRICCAAQELETRRTPMPQAQCLLALRLTVGIPSAQVPRTFKLHRPYECPTSVKASA